MGRSLREPRLGHLGEKLGLERHVDLAGRDEEALGRGHVGGGGGGGGGQEGVEG